MNDNEFVYYRGEGSQKRRKPKRGGAGKVILIIVICALLSLLIIFGVIMMTGTRYIIQETEDGMTVKFFGKVDKSGDTYSGKLYYSNG